MSFTISPPPVRVRAMIASSFSFATNSVIGTPLTVVEVVPHGTEVQAGDVVLKLDVRQVDKSLRDLEAALGLDADGDGVEDGIKAPNGNNIAIANGRS